MNEFIQNDTDPKSPYRVLLDLIPDGSASAVSMRSLSYALDLDPRAIRKRIEGARRDGNIIAGTESGYFIPENRDELLMYYRRSQKRIRTNSACLRAVRKKLRESETKEDEKLCYFSRLI